MKKIIARILILTSGVLMLAGCGNSAGETDKITNGTENSESNTKESDSETNTEAAPQVLKVAALESAYGADMWKEIAAAFEEKNEGVTVELKIEKNLEDVITPQMKAGDYPDVVHLAIGRSDALTETLIKENELTSLEDVLSMTVPGESVTVQEKLVGGFTDTLVTRPYDDGENYLLPMFYSPCGLFYNADLLEQYNWEVPETWDEMWELGDKALAEGIYLFTYPTAGYFDAFFYALMNSVGGSDFFNSAMQYEEGIWETTQAQESFDIMTKLAAYVEPSTVGNANGDNYLKNQQLVLDNKAIFMPNGTWVVGEMSEAPRADGFEWGFTALPAVEVGGERYSYTFFEQVWVPKQAENVDLGKEFLAFLYSDTAARIFAGSESPAVQPVKDVSDIMTDPDQILFYSIYDNGAKAAMGSFKATESVEGITMYDALFTAYDSIVSGDKTEEEWIQGIISASDQFRAVLQ